MRIISLVLAASVITACAANPSAPTDTRTEARTDAGVGLVASWVQRTEVGGTVLSFRLDTNAEGTTVTGSGSFTRQGAGSGTLTLTGTNAEGTVLLDIKFNNGEVAQFHGEQTKDSELTGGLHMGPAEMLTPAAIVTFDRRD
jgi:hypothetical protein